MSYYSVTLPVKPHIRKYITAMEGENIMFDSRSMLCQIVKAYLENSNKCGLSQNKMAANILSRTQEISIKIPVKKMGYIGHTIKPDNIVLINRFLEDIFERTLIQYVKDYIKEEKKEGRYKGYKDAYYAFAKTFGIEIDEDITLEGLQKIDYRNRQKITEKNFLALVLSPRTP